MLNEKKISKSGQITIPKHLRREWGIEGGEKVALELAENGNIVLKRIMGSCVLCGSHEELLKMGNRFICRSCQQKVAGLLEDETLEGVM